MRGRLTSRKGDLELEQLPFINPPMSEFAATSPALTQQTGLHSSPDPEYFGSDFGHFLSLIRPLTCDTAADCILQRSIRTCVLYDADSRKAGICEHCSCAIIDRKSDTAVMSQRSIRTCVLYDADSRKAGICERCSCAIIDRKSDTAVMSQRSIRTCVLYDADSRKAGICERCSCAIIDRKSDTAVMSQRSIRTCVLYDADSRKAGICERCSCAIIDRKSDTAVSDRESATRDPIGLAE
ncbi:hypothetical protein J6590_028634 [Homalodisca vitripennis]|nr:hypothetical protein J6590_028634 [Homalodisca vitripennis]